MIGEILARIREAAAEDEAWHTAIAPAVDGREAGASLHLAVLVEPYLTYLLDGRKTVESRFSTRAIPPFGRVLPGDVVLLKAASGPVLATCTVEAVWSYRMNRESWDEMRDRFGRALCAEGTFWTDRRHANYATLLRVANVVQLPPIAVPKRDRRGWVVLKDRTRLELL